MSVNVYRLSDIQLDELTATEVIEILNTDAQAEMDNTPGLWISLLTTDARHWAGYGIYTGLQLVNYLDACTQRELEKN
jgi:hypothetical protein